MKVFMRLFLAFLILGLAIFFSIFIDTHMMGVLNPQGIMALAEKNLMITAFCLMLIVVVPVFIMLFSFAWRYRAGNKHARYAPDFHESKTLETIWWLIPSIIIVMLATITWKSTHDLDPYKPLVSSEKPVTVEVVALDWKWLFIYPEEGVASVNFLQIPKDVPVHFLITADAPMNSFWIPELGGQIYAMPGMTTQLHLLGTKEGDYKGLSANFSGDGFSEMKFTARVSSKEEYEAWLQGARLSPYALTESEYQTLRKPSKNNTRAIYALIDASFFDKILMSFMMPSNSSSYNKEAFDGMMAPMHGEMK